MKITCILWCSVYYFQLVFSDHNRIIFSYDLYINHFPISFHEGFLPYMSIPVR